MVAQRELARRFARGAESGQATNVTIHKATGGYTLLVGYGWAVYAARSPNGTITAYRNWHGYSPATSSQLTRMGLTHPADTCIDSDHYRDSRQLADQYVDGAARLSEWDLSALDK